MQLIGTSVHISRRWQSSDHIHQLIALSLWMVSLMGEEHPGLSGSAGPAQRIAVTKRVLCEIRRTCSETELMLLRQYIKILV